MASVTLASNGLLLPDSDAYVGPLRPSPLSALADGRARAQLAAHGYVYLRGLLPRAQVLAMRERYFARFPTSFVQQGDRRRAAFSGAEPQGLPPYGTHGHPAYDFVRLPEFCAFAEDPLLRGAAEATLGGPAERLRRTPIRHFLPGRPASSRAHIDGTYVQADAGDVVTLWVPLGDCPIASGGLAYLEDSHQQDTIAQSTRFEARTVRTTNVYNINAFRLILRNFRRDDTHRFVVRIIQYLNFEFVSRIIQLDDIIYKAF